MFFIEDTNKQKVLEARRKRQEEKLELIAQLGDDILSLWELRNVAFRTLFVDEGLATPALRSNSFRCKNGDFHPAHQATFTTPNQLETRQKEDEQLRVRKLHDDFMQSRE